MRIKQFLIGFLTSSSLLIVSSCGQTASEKAQTQANHDDSLKNAVEQNIKQQYAAKEVVQNSIRTLNSQLNAFNSRIELLNANLEVANDEMSKIKEFHFGRTDGEREEQIRNQSLKIQNLEDEISDLNNKINQSNAQLAEYNSELEKQNAQP